MYVGAFALFCGGYVCAKRCLPYSGFALGSTYVNDGLATLVVREDCVRSLLCTEQRGNVGTPPWSHIAPPAC
jgi:hypothetical protein